MDECNLKGTHSLLWRMEDRRCLSLAMSSRLMTSPGSRSTRSSMKGITLVCACAFGCEAGERWQQLMQAAVTKPDRFRLDL
jgi:hypothetical protein